MHRCTVHTARMATQKRRVIYFSDEEWAHLRERAADAGTTASDFLRTLVIAGSARPDAVRFGAPRPTPKRTK